MWLCSALEQNGKNANLLLAVLNLHLINSFVRWCLLAQYKMRNTNSMHLPYCSETLSHQRREEVW